MKKVFAFEIENIDSLASWLGKGLSGYALQSAPHGRLTTLWLFLCDDSVLKIQSIVTTVGSWHEVGTLVFRGLKKSDVYLDAVLLESTWSDIAAVEQLVLDEEEFSAASGIAILNRSGAEIIVLSGAYPHTVEILAPFFDGDFQPEYEISAYQRRPLGNNRKLGC